ncbi:MAG: hypothetical protein H0X37_23865 [Herpetosiphonaceae bacterium]|nr:hypothetical protein [Herpetosiphonaceae bacterium]
MMPDSGAWHVWLDAHRSFAFDGRSGHLNLLKEARAGSGVGYWYAYRRIGSRTIKRYAGRSSELTTARLEEIAESLNQSVVTEPAASHPLVEQPRMSLPAPSEQLLAAKLQLPRLHSTLIDRTRLLVLLEEGRERVLTVIWGPAGFGKTTLVRQWLHAEPHATTESNEQGRTGQPPVAWVALDTGDNDPIRFWRYVITACWSFGAEVGATALLQLQLPPGPTFDPSPLDPALTTFLNALTATTSRRLLVLDDYHLITAPRIHETLTFFLDHLPTGLHVVIMTRHEPPLPLARLRARGDLNEVSLADLRFTLEETETFLEQNGTVLPAHAIMLQLEAQLGGWAAGLRLLALTLRGSATPTAVAAKLATFAGSQRPILQYFVAEVLSAQPAPLQDFLLRTSVLTRLSGPLCAAVTGVHNGAQLLTEVEQANLFLERLDDTGKWYRYHALFAEAMQAEARHRLGEECIRRLSDTASRWYETHGLLAEAVEAALQAEDMLRTAELIEQISVTPYLTLGAVYIHAASEFHTLRRWLEQIPPSEFERRPSLPFNYALALLFASFIDQARTPLAVLTRIEALLDQAEAGFLPVANRAKLGQIYAFRALLLRQRGDMQNAMAAGQLALAHLPDDDVAWRSIGLDAVGMGTMADGIFATAEAAFRQAHALCERIGNRWWTRTNYALLSYVLLERGQLRQADMQFRRMLAEAREEADQDDIARAQLCLALIAYEWNDLDTARQLASEALDLGEFLDDVDVWGRAAITVACIEHTQGQTALALHRLASLLTRLEIGVTPLYAHIAREVQRHRARTQLAVNDYAAVQRWIAERGHNSTSVARLAWEREERVIARLHIAQGTTDAALQILLPMLALAQETGRSRCVIEIRLLIALAQVECGQHREACIELRNLLSSAVEEGYQRLFLDEGATLRELLHSVYVAEREPGLREYMERILIVIGSEHALADGVGSSMPSPLIEPLSTHERRVLRLLAAGHSNPEIARELVVSVNTIRTHVQNIYRKLGVHNRVAASEAARRLELLRSGA